MAKQLKYDSEAKEKILRGVNALEKAVSVTLGPCGRNVIIDEYGSIHSTKDGVTVAKAITLKDPFENLGANAIKEVAEKSNSRVGDGTTTSTLLAAQIYRNGLKYVNVGANATQIKNGIKKAADHAIETVKSNSIKISSKEDIKRVAIVSANGDEKIGEMIADVMDKIGSDGTIKVENGNGTEMTSKIVEGMVIDESYASPYMITDTNTMEADLENPYVMIVNSKLSNIKEMVPALQDISQSGSPLFIIADDYAEDVLGSLIMNKIQGRLNSVAIKSPSYGDNRKAILNDIAILCGGQVIASETGVKLQNATLQSGIIGRAKRIIVTKDNTVIMGGCGEPSKIEERVVSLRTQIENSNSEFECNKLRERLAKLTSGIGVISVGATTEAERKELRDRVDDAFCAAKAAIKGGIVAGGGVALLSINKSLASFADSLLGDEKIGAMILQQSLSEPCRKIVENAGLDAGYVVNKILDSNESNYGYDALHGQYVNMLDAGIIDPTDVVVNEIQNASSVAGLLLTTEALIVEEVKESHNCGCAQPQMPMM